MHNYFTYLLDYDAFLEIFSGAGPPVGEESGSQRAWDQVSSEIRFDALFEQANQVHRARMLAAKHPHSGALLNAVPLSNLGLHLDDETLGISVAQRFGASVCEPHVCRCNRVVDRLAHCGLSCRYNAGRLPSHANLNDVVERGLAACRCSIVAGACWPR